MKRSALVLSAFALLLAAVSSPSSAALGDINLGPIVGVTFPTGDFGDQSGNGFAIGATGDYVLREQWSLGGDLIYNPFGGGEFRFGNTRSEYDWSVFHIVGHGKYYFKPAAETPVFGTAILGFYRGSADFVTRTEGQPDIRGDASSTEIGFGLGAGIEKTVMQDKTLVGQASIHFGDFDFFMLAVSLLFNVSSR